MKNLLPLTLLALVLIAPGCAWTKRHTPWHHQAASPSTTSSTAKPKSAASQTIVTPDDSMAAKVVTVNTVGRFVVLNFPEGKLPKIDQHMFLYRDGWKTAEVKIVGPQQDTSIVADIVSGEVKRGDTVRDQ